MPTTKIPSPASVRRALTTLKRFGAINNIDLEGDKRDAVIHVVLNKTLLSPKKTIKRKPRHKMIKTPMEDITSMPIEKFLK